MFSTSLWQYVFRWWVTCSVFQKGTIVHNGSRILIKFSSLPGYSKCTHRISFVLNMFPAPLQLNFSYFSDPREVTNLHKAFSDCIANGQLCIVYSFTIQIFTECCMPSFVLGYGYWVVKRQIRSILSWIIQSNVKIATKQFNNRNNSNNKVCMYR